MSPDTNAVTLATPPSRTGLVDVESSRAVAEAQAMMLVAKRFPRNEVVAIDKITNAFTRPGLAEKAKYQYARGGTDIEGPSIRSLEAIAQLWGNIRTGVKELSRSGNQSECVAYAWDLESGYFEEKFFTVKHVRDTKHGPKPVTEERDIYELTANMGARRKRACLEAVIPGDVIDIAMNQADATLHTKFEVTPERLKGLIEKFSEYGVTQEQIEKRIQRRLDAITPALLANLGKIYNSLKDGISKPTDWFEALSDADGGGERKGLRETLGVKSPAPPAPAGSTQTSAPVSEAQPTPKATSSAHGEPPIPFKDVIAMLKKAKTKEQGDVVLDTLNDVAYSDAQRAEGKGIYDGVVKNLAATA